MTLPEYIKKHGSPHCEALFGVSKWAIKSWRSGERTPRPDVANLIVQTTGGEVTLAGIYAQRPQRSA